MKTLSTEFNFLGIEETDLYSYEKAKFVIQSLPYEYTSSYLQGSSKGPAAIIEASRFVEFYDEELGEETYKSSPVATLAPVDFKNTVDAAAVDLIEQSTSKLIRDGKFVVSLGAEHTVTLGLVKAHAAAYPGMSVLQIDAHSDLRTSYHGNIYSHASVMARVHDLGIPLCQVGIRAQCKQEADLIRSSPSITTYYAHEIRKNRYWVDEAVGKLNENVYVTIDADGFDPSVIPAVGTAEPNGLFWDETLRFLRKVAKKKNIIGFDVVECAPMEGQALSEYTLAKLVYRLMGYITFRDKI